MGRAAPVVSRRRVFGGIAASMALLLVVMAGALLSGTQFIAPAEAFDALFGGGSAAVHTIIFDIRLPRIVLAASAGAALASAGAIFQALLRNPLAEPYILGVSNGCVVGAILGFILGVGPFVQPLLAFAGGGLVIVAVMAIGRGAYGLQRESLLLGGAMVAAIGAAAIFLLLHLVGPQLRNAIQWMLGDLSSTASSVGYASVGMLLLLLVASLFAGDTLNALALGDEEATSLGVNVVRARLIAFTVGSFIVGVTVAYCGAVGFVGLVVPHIVRRMFGPDHRVMLPLAVLGGAIFLLVCDTMARSLMPSLDSTATELPVGAVTALVGAPLFIYLLRRGVARQGA